MKLNVLLTGSGGSSAISFMKAFLNNLTINFFMGDLDPYAAGLYLVPAERRVILLPGEHPDFVAHLQDYCFANKIDVLIPTVDCELLPIAERQSEFGYCGTKVLLTSRESLEICLDKYKLLEACRESVPVPRSAIFDELFNPADWEFPLFIKPRTGAGSRGIMKIDSTAELAKVERNAALLIQEFLPGEEYSVDVLTTKTGKVIAAVPRERMKIDSGIAVTARTLHDADLENFACRVAELVGLTYTVNIQFRRNRAGKPCLLEVNPRFPGTMPLTVASGVNMPKLSLEHLIGKELTTEMGNFRDIAMVRYWQEKFMPLAEISALQQPPFQREAEAEELISFSELVYA